MLNIVPKSLHFTALVSRLCFEILHSIKLKFKICFNLVLPVNKRSYISSCVLKCQLKWQLSCTEDLLSRNINTKHFFISSITIFQLQSHADLHRQTSVPSSEVQEISQVFLERLILTSTALSSSIISDIFEGKIFQALKNIK